HGGHPCQNLRCPFVQLDLGGVKDRGVLARGEYRIRGQIENLQSLERPSVRSRGRLQLVLGLGQRDVESTLARPRALEEELQPQGRLSGPGIALDQIETIARQAAAENVVEARDPGTGERL